MSERPISAPSAPRVSPEAMRQLVAQQLRVMQQQLAALSRTPRALAQTAQQPIATAPTPVAETPPLATAATPLATAEPSLPAEAVVARPPAVPVVLKVPAADLTPQQRNRLDAFVRRYTARTRKSKAFSETHRAQRATAALVAGPRASTDDLAYPLVVQRSEGAHVWDIDGNDYVDASNGGGASYFGWQPEFISEAVVMQMAEGHALGTVHPLAAEVAALFCELTGKECAAFCSTEAEATREAVRMARALTGRSRVLAFEDPQRESPLTNLPDVHTRAFDSDAARSFLGEHGSTLAAIFVTPDDLAFPQPDRAEFLSVLRSVADSTGALLVFDETVTGLRTGPDGAQGELGVQADLATYGKALGGGFQLACIAGKSEFMAAFGGGSGTTQHAHPLSLAAAKAVLLRMREEGPALQEGLNARTAALSTALNRHFESVSAPLRVTHFGSLWLARATTDLPHADLLFHHLCDRGVYVRAGDPCFLTTAHAEREVTHIVHAFKESVAELQAAGFMPGAPANVEQTVDLQRPPVPGARLGRDQAGLPAWFVPHPDNPKKYIKFVADPQ